MFGLLDNFKSQVEEAIANATDFWGASPEGTFILAARPWLGYLIMLQDNPKSTQPATKSGKPPHYLMRTEFVGANYAKRCEICCERPMRERLYDAACFIMSGATDGPRGRYLEPNAELRFQNFANSIVAGVAALAKHKGGETRS